ncbi:Fimbrial protein [compost metagenome]
MPKQINVVLPATITLSKANIGDVLASYTNVHSTTPTWSCQRGDKYGLTAPGITLTPTSGFDNVYDSGVAGVGIRVSFDSHYGNWGGRQYAPLDYEAFGPTVPVVYPDKVIVEFIRTGMAVGSGETLPLSFSTDFYVATNPQSRSTISATSQKTKLINKVYYTSCYNPSPYPTVDLGRPYKALVQQGQVTEKAFSLNIRCDGLNPTTKPPVKIYYEGKSPRDGVLDLTGAGQPGVAKGVGIALTNDKGVALPFTKAKALPLTWQASAPDAELYRFDAKAKYIATGGEVTAGKANTTLTYVLEYN